MSTREQMLDAFSEIILPSGIVTRKLDFLGTIRINGRHYFNVWRRYNNVYEIVFEDFSGDFHYHKNYTIGESIQKILCQSDEQMKGVHTIEAISFKHRADISEEVTTMRWTELQHQWYALDMNIGGILYDTVAPTFTSDITPVRQLQIQQVPQAPQAGPVVRNMDRMKPLSLSERFAAVENQSRSWTPLSSEEEFTILRNGTKIHKPRPRDSEKPHPRDSEKPHPRDSEKPHPRDSEKPHPRDSEKPRPRDTETLHPYGVIGKPYQ